MSKQSKEDQRATSEIFGQNWMGGLNSQNVKKFMTQLVQLKGLRLN